MQACKVVLHICAIVLFGSQTDGRPNGNEGEVGRNGSETKGGQGGHPFEHHINPTSERSDRFVGPFEISGEPVNVEVQVFVQEVGPLNLDDNSFTIVVVIKQAFNDSRLAYQPSIGAQEYFKLTSAEEINKIWQPDTFVRNERKIHFHETLQSSYSPLNKAMYATIFSTGRILISQRVTLKLSCPGLREGRTFSFKETPENLGTQTWILREA